MNRDSVRSAVLRAVVAATALSAMNCAIAPQPRDGGADDAASEASIAPSDGFADLDASGDQTAIGSPDASWVDGRGGGSWADAFSMGCEPVHQQQGSTCIGWMVSFPCGMPPAVRWTEADGGRYIDPNDSSDPALRELCLRRCSEFGHSIMEVTPYCAFIPDRDSGTGDKLQCGMICAGRRVEGVRTDDSDEPSGDGCDPYGYFLAECARLEAIAVVAFEQLAVELARLGAPSDLVERATIAAEDERRHTAAMSSLANARGASERPFSFEPKSTRTLFDIALENRVEGCVRESFGATIAAYQARHAKDSALRAALPAIAAEELSHAEWSWDLDAWLRTQLSAAQCAALDEAQRNAIDALRPETTVPALVSLAGMPDALAANELVRELKASLWSERAQA